MFPRFASKTAWPTFTYSKNPNNISLQCSINIKSKFYILPQIIIRINKKPFFDPNEESLPYYSNSPTSFLKNFSNHLTRSEYSIPHKTGYTCSLY